ncbi:hypothetical protein QNI19_02890 [Cytophagaceae bacterium DM2B3-1]|uniref:DUF4190 domain-containing protein n=1 Tax=Xanthocytophaga flava TaxID=3048013 RepID=A0ABT7CDZ4_9BACT|nr:hypothetical protein [Xanthocytophaga flavus]MDJ1472682.1 hypothetical protein [Xanthocytophaga flavus]MDJ1491862.1 hypothetical protein [Xanthocytophaga flavus]
MYPLRYRLYRLSYVLFITVSLLKQAKAQTEVACPDTLVTMNAQGAQMPMEVMLDSPSNKHYSEPQKQGSVTIVPGIVKDSIKLYVHRKKLKLNEQTSQKLGRISLRTTISAYVLAFVSLEIAIGTFSLIIGLGAILLAITGMILGVKSLNGTHKNRKSRIPAMVGFFFSLMMLVAFAAAIAIWMYTP